MKPPVEEGQEYEMECISKGQKGDGICKYEGYVVIVPGAEPEQTYKVRITKVKDKFGFGEIA
jgi:23S rRNA (uridine2552-2'-O)-methyltransferase